jgi:Ca2+-binding RTX toxin-like protein
MAVINGTSDDDLLEGTSSADVIRGFAGNDRLFGFGNNDQMYGGLGNDQLDGGAGSGPNRLYGEDGDDILRDAGRGSLIDGGAGIDRAIVDRSAATSNLSLAFATGRAATLSDGTILQNIETLDLVTGGGRDRVTLGALGPGSYSWDGGQEADSITLDFSGLAVETHMTSRLDTLPNSHRTVLARTVTAGETTINLREVEAVTIKGGSLRDYWSVYVGVASLWGNGGDDVLVGGAGNDDLYGGEGNDVLWGEQGKDTLDGGAGDDVLIGSQRVVQFEGGNKIFGGDGDDKIEDMGRGSQIDGGRGTDWLDLYRPDLTGDVTANRSGVMSDGTTFMNIERLWITTGSGNDRLTGGGLDDVLSAGAGNDVLSGGGGNDFVSGGSGRNRLNGGDGDDTMSDAGVASTIDGGAGFDRLTLVLSSLTEDVIFTFDPATTAYVLPDGTRFKNVEALSLTTGSGNDQLTGLVGDDSFSAGAGNDTLKGGAGNDQLAGGTGTNHLEGGDGDDRLSDSGVASALDGGDGNDSASIDRSWLTEDVTLEFRPIDGQDHTLPDGTVFDNVEQLNLVTGSGNDDVAFGGLGPGTISGDRHSWNGGSGDDHATLDFSDSAGVVRFFGYEISVYTANSVVKINVSNVEAVTVIGGSGNDTMSGGPRTVTFDGGGGADGLRGTRYADVLMGGDGNDTIDGDPGNDRLTGGAGDDTLIGGPGRDVYIFAASSGHDTVAGFQDGVDTLDVSAFGYHSLADLTAAGGSVAADGTGTLVTLSAAGETVRLDLVPPGLISGADFIFA